MTVRSSSSPTEAASRGETVLVAAVFLGLAYTGATNGHIAVDLVTDRLPRRASRWVDAFGWSSTALILLWLAYATGARALESTEKNESRMGLVNWPLWPARWLIVVGLVATLLVAVVNVARHLDVDPELALRAATDKFRTRFEGVEQLAAERGIDLATADLATLDMLWDEVKAIGR